MFFFNSDQQRKQGLSPTMDERERGGEGEAKIL